MMLRLRFLVCIGMVIFCALHYADAPIIYGICTAMLLVGVGLTPAFYSWIIVTILLLIRGHWEVGWIPGVLTLYMHFSAQASMHRWGKHLNEKQKILLSCSIGAAIAIILVTISEPRMRTLEFIAGGLVLIGVMTVISLFLLKGKISTLMSLMGFTLGGTACWFLAGAISLRLCLNIPKTPSGTIASLQNNGGFFSGPLLFIITIPAIWAIVGAAVHIQMTAFASFISGLMCRKGEKQELSGHAVGYLILFAVFWGFVAGILLSWLLLEHIEIPSDILKPASKRIFIGCIGAAVATLVSIPRLMKIPGVWHLSLKNNSINRKT
jgi:hypothetical protein